MANNRRLTDLMRAYERSIITRTLQETGGNVSAAARSLDVPHRTLCAKIKRHGIDLSEYR